MTLFRAGEFRTICAIKSSYNWSNGCMKKKCYIVPSIAFITLDLIKYQHEDGNSFADLDNIYINVFLFLLIPLRSANLAKRKT